MRYTYPPAGCAPIRYRLYMMMSEEAMATPPTQEKAPAEENVAENSKYIYFYCISSKVR